MRKNKATHKERMGRFEKENQTGKIERRERERERERERKRKRERERGGGGGGGGYYVEVLSDFPCLSRAGVCFDVRHF